MSQLKRLIHEIHRRSLWQVLAIYLLGSWAAYEAVEALVSGLGLPDWVPGFAIVLLIIGLPIVLATAFIQEGGPELGRADPTLLPEAEAARPAAATRGRPGSAPEGVHRIFNWRNAIAGGVLAFALLGVTVTGYMAMRTLGVGPVGSLVAAGVLDPRERIILADFENHTGDSLLAVVVTEAFRVDLAQSPIVSVAEPGYVARVLERMDRDPGTRLSPELAREVAIREGIQAVLVGEIGTVGGGYVLSGRLVGAEDGAILTAHRRTADDSSEVMDAIDRLSKDLRERIGESLKSIRANEPLERVTTGSLEALQKYSQAVRTLDVEGDEEKAIGLLEEAVAMDTAFAMAWRKLGVVLGNRGEERGRIVEALTHAFQRRDRLTDRERYLTIATYHSFVTGDHQRARTAYRTLLDTYPDETTALNNLAVLDWQLGEDSAALALGRRAVELDPFVIYHHFQVVTPLVNLGEYAAAETALAYMAESLPDHPWVEMTRHYLETARGRYAAAESALARIEARRLGGYWQAAVPAELAETARIQGRVREAARQYERAMSVYADRGLPGEYVRTAALRSDVAIQFGADTAAALRGVNRALARYPLESIADADRPYLPLARFYAYAGTTEQARRMLAAHDSIVGATGLGPAFVNKQLAEALIPLAESPAGRVAERIRRGRSPELCRVCTPYLLGRAYDRTGEPDSAIAAYERAIETPYLFRKYADSHYLADALQRLAELHEARGDAERAVYYYGRLIELWEDADPQLQPRVDAARRAIGALASDRAGAG